MTTEKTPDILELSPGETVSTCIDYQGIQYRGEVISASSWDASLGAPIQGDSFFRIVFLDSYEPIDTQQIQDARIALCVPPRSERKRERVLEQERRVLKEVRARYAVPEMERALQETQRQIYAAGTVVTHAGSGLLSQTVFQAGSIREWVSVAAQALMSWTYPRLPVDASSFPRTLTYSDPELLFRGLVQGDTGTEAIAAVRDFASGLGLAPPPNAGADGFEGSPVLRIIRDETMQLGGSWPCDQLFQRMAHVHGLPYPLISLYLMVFLAFADPPAELRLRPDHRLQTIDGSPYSGQTVVAETVASLKFTPQLGAEGESLRFASPVSWSAISLYFSPLEPELAYAGDEAGESESTSLLMETLNTLQADVRRVETAMNKLGDALGDEMPEDAAALLDRFRRLGRSQAPDTALLSARQLFGTPEGLARGIARYRSLQTVADLAGVIARSARYVHEAHVPDDMQPLALTRQALQATLRLSELAGTAFSAEALLDQIEQFREQYQHAYRKDHDSYCAEMAALHTQLQDADLQASALERLNQIGDLGEPVGTESLERQRKLQSTVQPCPATGAKIPLSKTPTCGRCGFRLGSQAPTAEVATVIGEVERGLREQNQRLSLHVVHRILGGDQDERIQRFIQVVQVSDLSGLANVLDSRLAEFLREVLSTR